jgi:hypothetical protein
MMTAFVAFEVGLNRRALWQVVRACVVDFKLTTAPYPCLAVNLSGGEELSAQATRRCAQPCCSTRRAFLAPAHPLEKAEVSPYCL